MDSIDLVILMKALITKNYYYLECMTKYYTVTTLKGGKFGKKKNNT
jgi:hypothetical protein